MQENEVFVGGDYVWRSTNGYGPAQPAVVSKVTSFGFATTHVLYPNEKPTQHRVGKVRVRGVHKMNAADVERVVDLKQWKAMKFLRATEMTYGSIAVTAFTLRECARALTAEDILTLRTELHLAEHLLARETMRQRDAAERRPTQE